MMRTSMSCEVSTETSVDLRCEVQVWLVAIIRIVIHTIFFALHHMGNWYGANTRFVVELPAWSSKGTARCYGG